MPCAPLRDCSLDTALYLFFCLPLSYRLTQASPCWDLPIIMCITWASTSITHKHSRKKKPRERIILCTWYISFSHFLLFRHLTMCRVSANHNTLSVCWQYWWSPPCSNLSRWKATSIIWLDLTTGTIGWVSKQANQLTLSLHNCMKKRNLSYTNAPASHILHTNTQNSANCRM